MQYAKKNQPQCTFTCKMQQSIALLNYANKQKFIIKNKLPDNTPITLAGTGLIAAISLLFGSRIELGMENLQKLLEASMTSDFQLNESGPTSGNRGKSTEQNEQRCTVITVKIAICLCLHLKIRIATKCLIS